MIAVYCIANVVNGKCYIGQTARGMAIRWQAHVSDANYGRGNAFGAAIRKYGSRSFSVTVLRNCQSRDESDVWEKYFIGGFNSYKGEFGYNLTLGGYQDLRLNRIALAKKNAALSMAQKGRPKSPEHCAALAKAHVVPTKETYEKIAVSVKASWDRSPGRKLEASLRCKGKKRPEMGAKISAALKGKPKSSEHRAKLAAANRGKHLSAECRLKISETLRRRHAA